MKSFTARKLLRITLLTLPALLLAMVGAEFFLRTWYPVRHWQPARSGKPWHELVHRSSAFDGLAYEMAPNRSASLPRFDTASQSFVPQDLDVNTNSFGMRDSEPDQQTPPPRRVVVLGDSFTFGLGVKVEEIYPSILENLLNHNSSDSWEVLNLGVVGYSSLDEAVVMRQKAMKWNPDLVVIGYVLNDPEDAPIQPLHAQFDSPEPWQYSHLARLIVLGFDHLQVRRIGGGNYVRYLHNHPKKWAGVQRAFRTIKEVAEESETPVLLVVFPVSPKSKTWDNYAERDVHKMVTDLGKTNGFYTLDLLTPMSEYEPWELRQGPDHHPSPLAHQVASEAILSEMERVGLRKAVQEALVP